MAFVPVTLLTISTLVLVSTGMLMLQASRGAPASRFLVWSGGSFLCLGAGFALLLAAPPDVDAPLRILGNTAVPLSYGLLWGAARHFDGRPALFDGIVAGALVWLVAASLFDPSHDWRIGIASAIPAAYSFAIAWEHHRGGGTPGETLPARRSAGRVFAGHGALCTLRALFGPTLGVVTWAPHGTQLWGALLAVETAVMAVLVGVLSLAMSRARSAGLRPREALDDGLTGIGNRLALSRSGSALVAEARRAGQPAALLLMDLDGFTTVNARHGPAAGDGLLVAFARLAHDYLPPTSLVCRIGGQAFAAVLPGADPERARAIADEIRALFAHLVIDGPRGPLRTTVSIGIARAAPAERAEGEVGMAGLLESAASCLQAAKRGGRDRVVAEGDPAADAASPVHRRPAA